jgi:hypothetical protein
VGVEIVCTTRCRLAPGSYWTVKLTASKFTGVVLKLIEVIILFVCLLQIFLLTTYRLIPTRILKKGAYVRSRDTWSETTRVMSCKLTHSMPSARYVLFLVYSFMVLEMFSERRESHPPSANYLYIYLSIYLSIYFSQQTSDSFAFLNPICILEYVLNCEQNFSFFTFWSGLSDNRINCNRISEDLI